MELSVCSVSSKHNRQQNSSHAVRQHWGQKILKRTYIFAHTICVRNGLDLVVYKMYYNKRPGLGLQYVLVIFPDHTRLFFWSLVEKEYECTTADTESVQEIRCLFFVVV